MTASIVTELDPTRPAPALLALNNAHARELSPLTLARLTHLIGEAFMAAQIGEAEALLLAFDQAADYDSENFLWFRDRFDRFVYVDRVVVDPKQRGRGVARSLYHSLFERAGAAGHSRIVCEVNLDPPNSASDAFHAALGFHELETATLADGKTVRYFEKPLSIPVKTHIKKASGVDAFQPQF